MNYFAFISYKRGGIDETVANWIHSKLEKYPYPQNLVALENRPEHKTLIRRVFLDTKDLHVDEKEFTERIKEAIKEAKYLIVVCSKLSAKSQYVNNEVAYFLETHENDYDKILPVFIDTVEGGLPPTLINTNILSRHCPIYNSFLSPKNEINLYCFYHVVSFLLKVDFRSIYDRYKRYAAKKEKRTKHLKNIFSMMILVAVILLGCSLYTQCNLVQKKDELVLMERDVFPYSVVVGYTNNFLKPVVNYLKENDTMAHVYIHMPIHKDGIIRHSDRVMKTSLYIQNQLEASGLDSIRPVKLNTSMKRGSIILKFYSSTNPELNKLYLDFATTTSTFLEIAERKKEKFGYQDQTIDEMINEYTNTFIRQANEQLDSDSISVSFITDENEIINKFRRK